MITEKVALEVGNWFKASGRMDAWTRMDLHSKTCKTTNKGGPTWRDAKYPARLRRNNNTVWKFYKNGSRLTRDWMQHTPNRSKPSMKCRFWYAENAKAVNQGTSGIQSLSSPSNPDPDAQQTIRSVFKSVLSMQNMGCHSVAEQLMAAGATDEEVKKISQIMAQTVRELEGGNTIPELGIEVLKPACEVVVLDAELPSCIPGFSSMDIEGQEAIKRSLSNAATEKRRLAKKCKQEEDVL